MFNIAVAGTGYVGLVAGACFARVGYNVTCVDVDENKINTLNSGVCPIYEQELEQIIKDGIRDGKLSFTTDYRSAYKNADFIFIGVGTPEREDGSANLSFVASVARQIASSVERDCIVVVKSTVPVGTNDKVESLIKEFLVNDVDIHVVSNPEFLSQGTAVHDTLEAARIVVGSDSEYAAEMMRRLYAPFNLPIVSVGRRSAEMIKYASNDFLALKISYMNDIANLCELVGADITEVAEGMRYDNRIGPKFLNAGVGYGGSCFPKDTSALSFLANYYGYELKTVQAAIDVNKRQKTVLFRKAQRKVITFEGLKVAVLGLTFKPNTDDLREAPSIDNIRLLLEEKADIYAYDPIGADNYRRQFPAFNINYVSSPEQAIENANVCFIFTEWEQIKAVKPEVYKKLMRKALVFDGRNIYSPDEMNRCGVEYYSIGR